MAPSPVSAPGHAAAVGVLLVPTGSGGPSTPCLAFPLPSPRGMRGGLAAQGTKYLLLAPAASHRDVRCFLRPGNSSKDINTLGLAAPPEVLPAAKVRVPPAQSSRSPFNSMGQGTPLVALGVLPVASRETHLVHASSSSPPPSTFSEEFALLLEEIPTNSFALVGQHDVFVDIVASAERALDVVGKLTPVLVEMLTKGRQVALQPKGLIDFVKLNGLEIATAVTTVRAECLEGYVREESLIRAINKVRELPTSLVLPPAYAGTTTATSDKANKIDYFNSLAKEFDELSIVVWEGMVQMVNK